MFDVVKDINDMLAIIKNKILDKVVCIFEIVPIRTTESRYIAVLTEALICSTYIILKIIGLAFVNQFKVTVLNCKVVKYYFIVAVLVSVVFITILFIVGRELFVCRKIAHNSQMLPTNYYLIIFLHKIMMLIIIPFFSLTIFYVFVHLLFSNNGICVLVIENRATI